MLFSLVKLHNLYPTKLYLHINYLELSNLCGLMAGERRKGVFTVYWKKRKCYWIMRNGGRWPYIRVIRKEELEYEEGREGIWRQILEEVLSLEGLFSDQVNITPLIKASTSKMLGRAPKQSFFFQRITLRSISAEPTEHCWHRDSWY